MRGRVVLGVSGGIAAFRAVEVLRGLVRAGCRVHTILTENATRFVGPRTFAVLSTDGAEASLWSDPTNPGVDHVALGRGSDLLLVVPATANVLAKMASGVADDALTTYALAHRGRLVVAPAMNTAMWRHAATQRALATLRERGATVVEPVSGFLAEGETGLGKLAAVDDIVGAALAALPPRGALAGVRVLVSAGPTREPIDAVRVITNRSSGRMGVALAVAARDLGAEVRLLAGPAVPAPPGIAIDRFETAADLGRLLGVHGADADVVWHAAAVADFRPAAVAEGKLDRRQGPLQLTLEPVPDLAAAMPRAQGRPYLAIFAAERAADLEARAAAKMAAKGADAVVANPIDEPGLGMEEARNRAVVLTRLGIRREFAAQGKEALARELLLALAGEVVAARRR
ncbi:MAG: bifunctional phosphopantothenoylcysteine decarboxylase/phosphopantothenate--cysteine ligase CoaBC [Thermoanaerobaculaceae bacterium]|nr:bifunctional phosphopantothenoylcysteine decarboxylase/phosphopantothenate--cysteine ligase CoaBC [Thermoanaerobaculaceae bacterium]TAM56064.1 MAG: bifunctional phosphopantothenoylcysteine decarboxylase/phosphopantothenate--cysteine ligase CoaBC [Acidobacteriota bacterium]